MAVRKTVTQSKSATTQTKPATSQKVCYFCANHKEPDYTDTITLRKFISDRAKILGKQRTKTCSKHQRRLAKQIKYARHLALLPFVNQV